jgi:hypothetical protein
MIIELTGIFISEMIKICLRISHTLCDFTILDCSNYTESAFFRYL